MKNIDDISKEDVKELEKQKREIESKLKKHYDNETAERIKNNEKKYVGKCYKTVHKTFTEYMKCLSGLTNNSYCYMHCMNFILPVNVGFRHSMSITNNSKYDYYFDDDLLCFDEMKIQGERVVNNIKEAEEISVEEFEAALKEYGRQLIEVSRDDYTMNGKYFKE